MYPVIKTERNKLRVFIAELVRLVMQQVHVRWVGVAFFPYTIIGQVESCESEDMRGLGGGWGGWGVAVLAGLSDGSILTV